MAFALPQIVGKKKTPDARNSRHAFAVEDVKSKVMIGEGGFGKVYKGAFLGEVVVIKILNQVSKAEVEREARFMRKLSHKNILGFRGIDFRGTTIMLDLMEFDFSSFGKPGTVVHSLDEFLKIIKENCAGFEHMILFCASINQTRNGVLTFTRYCSSRFEDREHIN